eukprot:399681-Amphidinium_carterae.1
MQTQTANFPIPTGSCKDCGHAYVRAPPPGLGSPKPSVGMKPQTPSAAAVSPVPDFNFSQFSGAGGSTHPRPGRSQGHGYESFLNRRTILRILLSLNDNVEMEEIFQDIVMTTTTKTRMMTGLESMIINMLKCLDGVTFARRNVLPRRDVFGVAFAVNESCMSNA